MKHTEAKTKRSGESIFDDRRKNLKSELPEKDRRQSKGCSDAEWYLKISIKPTKTADS